MNNIFSGFLRKADIFGKYIDQPALIKSVYKKMPPVLMAGAAGFGLYDTFNNKKVKQGEESILNRFVKNAAVLTGTVASVLIFGKKFIHLPHACKNGLKNMAERFKNDKTLSPLINKVREGKILGFSQVKTLYEGLEKQGKNGENLISKLIPTGHSHHGHGHGFLSKHPEFGEIRDLSILGLIPVLGGIAGGAAGDLLTGEKLGKTMPDKLNEGSYQYLANIVLCNVGAGAALFAVNRTRHKNSKPVKFFSMLVGILAVGVAGGSFIANLIGKEIVNPLVGRNHPDKKHGGQDENFYKELYSERTPEAIDIGLHIDDVASAGFLSGLNVIAPILPVLYSVSAYRAGVGYRNSKEVKTGQTQSHTGQTQAHAEQTHVEQDFSSKKDIFHAFREKKFHYHHQHS